jgi:hypothetical protein
MPLKKDVACQKMIEFFLHHSQCALWHCCLVGSKSSACGDIHKKRTIAPATTAHKPVLCTHTQTADPPPSYSFVAIVFLDPNRKPQLLGIVVNDRLTSGSSIPPLWSSVFCATSARWFHDRQQLVDKEIIQSCFVVAADAISFFGAVRYIRKQGGGA